MQVLYEMIHITKIILLFERKNLILLSIATLKHNWIKPHTSHKNFFWRVCAKKRVNHNNRERGNFSFSFFSQEGEVTTNHHLSGCTIKYKTTRPGLKRKILHSLNKINLYLDFKTSKDLNPINSKIISKFLLVQI